MAARKIQFLFRTTKKCHSWKSLSWVWKICSPNLILTCTASWGHYVSSFDSPAIKSSLLMQARRPECETRAWGIIYFCDDILGSPGLNRDFIVPCGIIFAHRLSDSRVAASSSSCQIIMNNFGNIAMKFGKEFWQIFFWEYINRKLFAVYYVMLPYKFWS
jgi:hypothetical protein